MERKEVTIHDRPDDKPEDNPFKPTPIDMKKFNRQAREARKLLPEERLKAMGIYSINDVIEAKQKVLKDVSEYKVRTGCILISEAAFKLLEQKHSHLKLTKTYIKCDCIVDNIRIVDEAKRIVTCKKCKKQHHLSVNKFKLLKEAFRIIASIGKLTRGK